MVIVIRDWRRNALKFHAEPQTTRVVNFINILRTDILVPKNLKPKTQLCNFWRPNFVLKMRS